VLQNGPSVVQVDARPSDAIALALRVGCPILVEEETVKKAREVNLQARPIRLAKLDEDSVRDYLSNLAEADFGKWKM
jgi:bifunctional DNase/RNase